MSSSAAIGYEQLLAAIKKLPAAKIKQLRLALDDSYIRERASEELSDFQNFLLRGPVMTTGQYENHLTDRKHFRKWRTK